MTLCRQFPRIYQELQVGRVGVDVTVLGGHISEHNTQNKEQHYRHLNDPVFSCMRSCFLKAAYTLLYLLQWSFPGSDVYAVWNHKGGLAYFTNAQARVLMTMTRRMFNSAYQNRLLPSWNVIPQVPEIAEQVADLVTDLVNLKVGNIVYSNNSTGTSTGTGSGTSIMEVEAPEAAVP